MQALAVPAQVARRVTRLTDAFFATVMVTGTEQADPTIAGAHRDRDRLLLGLGRHAGGAGGPDPGDRVLPMLAFWLVGSSGS